MVIEYFRGAMGLFATGVTVVTTSGPDGEPYGVTVSSFTSVSLDPLLISICLDNSLSGLDRFSEERLFAVNILSENQQEISNHFATPGSDRSAASERYLSSSSGTPLLKEPLAALECQMRSRIPGGDHTIILGEVVSIHISPAIDETRPLVYFRGEYRKLLPSD